MAINCDSNSLRRRCRTPAPISDVMEPLRAPRPAKWDCEDLSPPASAGPLPAKLGRRLYRSAGIDFPVQSFLDCFPEPRAIKLLKFSIRLAERSPTSLRIAESSAFCMPVVKPGALATSWPYTSIRNRMRSCSSSLMNSNPTTDVRVHCIQEYCEICGHV